MVGYRAAELWCSMHLLQYYVRSMSVLSLNWNWNWKYILQITNNITEIQIHIHIQLTKRIHAQNEYYSIA